MGVGFLDNKRIIVDRPVEDIYIISINTGKYNTLNIEDISEINAILRILENDEKAKILGITGKEKSFCTGLVVFSLKKENIQNIIEVLYTFDLLLYNIYKSHIFIISGINGHCIGGGAVLALTTDYRILEDNPKIKVGFPEYNIGLFLPTLMIDIVRHKLKMDSNVFLWKKFLSPLEAMIAGFADMIEKGSIVEKIYLIGQQIINMHINIKDYKRQIINYFKLTLPELSNPEYIKLAKLIIELK